LIGQVKAHARSAQVSSACGRRVRLRDSTPDLDSEWRRLDNYPDTGGLGREEWSRVTLALAENRIPRDEVEVIGNLMAVDYETMCFELRSIVDLEIRSVRCQHHSKHEQIVKTHGKKRVKVHWLADFDRNHNPGFMVVENIIPIL
jgi:hypothetical protein